MDTTMEGFCDKGFDFNLTYWKSVCCSFEYFFQMFLEWTVICKVFLLEQEFIWNSEVMFMNTIE